jgi:hypothetical protein
MVRQIFFIIAFLSFAYTMNAQRIRFSQMKSVEYNTDTEEWDEWPDEWTTIPEDTRVSMQIVETVKGKTYKVTLFIDGEESSSISVTYDGAKSAKVRKDWDDPYVNCYLDDAGDYIYAQKVSLEQLAKDSSPWKDIDDSTIYFCVLSENVTYAFR